MSIALEKLPIVEELEKSFAYLNYELFDDDLQLLPFIVQIDKKIAIRYFPESFHMVIGSKFATIGFRDMQQQLLHEMCHVYNYKHGIVDCTSNQYHNQKFLNKALEVGLFSIRHKTQGWGNTSFSPPSTGVSCWNCGEDYDSKKVCSKCHCKIQIAKPEKNDQKRRIAVFKNLEFCKTTFSKAKNTISKNIDRSPRKICFLKYECQCKGHNSFRTGRRPDGKNPVNAKCQDCGHPFECVEDSYT
ncbi:MAG: hypothetical protein ACW99G_02800 [Candidatus Thorarchaeota archaeon]|jgi:hypothetical protein